MTALADHDVRTKEELRSLIEDYINDLYAEIVLFVRRTGLQNGECAFCLLDGEGTQHLVEHLERREYSYAIFRRAVADYGYINPAAALDEALMDPDLPEFKHMLRRYFRKQLIGEL